MNVPKVIQALTGLAEILSTTNDPGMLEILRETVGEIRSRPELTRAEEWELKQLESRIVEQIAFLVR